MVKGAKEALESADPKQIEKKAEEILACAKDKKVAFLVVGDVFSATTHTDMMLRAKEKGMKVEIIHNASILNAVGATGLELYKFGKTTSIPFPEEGFRPQTPYDVIKQNQKFGLHTLCLLDIKMKEPSKEDLKKGRDNYQPSRFMTVNDAIRYLLETEGRRKEGVFTENTLVVGCARLGAPDQKIMYSTAGQLLKADMGKPLQCLIVTGEFHFMEEEAVQQYEI